MTTTRVLGSVGVVAVAAWMAACGGDSGPGTCGTGQTGVPPNCVTIVQTPAAGITASGSGALVLHPSADNRFSFALETPVRITETGGGTADWNFARISVSRGGREIERYEIGADVIDRAGFKKIAARSDKVYSIAFRMNSDDFDGLDITLGFADLKDARTFTAAVGLNSFTDVTLSTTPLAVPRQGTIRLPGQ